MMLLKEAPRSFKGILFVEIRPPQCIAQWSNFLTKGGEMPDENVGKQFFVFFSSNCGQNLKL